MGGYKASEVLQQGGVVVRIEKVVHDRVVQLGWHLQEDVMDAPESGQEGSPRVSGARGWRFEGIRWKGVGSGRW